MIEQLPVPKRQPNLLFGAVRYLDGPMGDYQAFRAWMSAEWPQIRNPLDVTSADDVRWLECLVWPEQHERLDRLRGAIRIARSEPAHLMAGDLNGPRQKTVRPSSWPWTGSRWPSPGSMASAWTGWPRFSAVFGSGST
ncbi:DUF2332 family protein [Nonomuraea sp. NPDC052129]|uniref:DUF2332 family protein n=1 Tax=Nonomuraea sp. NPDC052129 TaxID=3154651 RepID=UPI003435711E